jgi:hypothetical protein
LAVQPSGSGVRLVGTCLAAHDGRNPPVEIGERRGWPDVIDTTRPSLAALAESTFHVESTFSTR